MNDQPVQSVKPAMIHIDLSNAIPAGAYNYIAAFLPGLFFVVSLTLANPGFVSKVAANLPAIFPLSEYVKLGIGLFLAFVIGNGFMMGITLIQWMLGYIYRLAAFFRRLFYSWIVFPVVNKYISKPSKSGQGGRPLWVVKLHQRAHLIRYGIEENERQDFNRCLYTITRQLLETKYGIRTENIRDLINWQIFYVTLATPTREEMRGETLMIATHATGWCGLVATRLAPALENRYYLLFSLLMVAVGLLHDFYLARRMNNPVLTDFMNIRGLLREFPKPSSASVARSELGNERP